MDDGEADEASSLLSASNEENVTRAYKFLTHPRVASAPLAKRISFLQSKNCSPSDIEEALKRANLDEEAMRSSNNDDGLEGGSGDLSDQPRKSAKTSKGSKRSAPLSKSKARAKPARRLGPGTAAMLSCLFCLGLLVGLYFLLVHYDVIPVVTQWFHDIKEDTESDSSHGDDDYSPTAAPTITFFPTSYAPTASPSIMPSSAAPSAAPTALDVDDDSTNSVDDYTSFSYDFSYSYEYRLM